MSNVEIIHADAVQWAKEYRGEKFHALLCDPPYALGEPRSGGNGHGQMWQSRTDEAKASRRSGFMGKKWDNDIAFNPDTWAAFAEVLHAGAFGMAFASSRGWHRLACAIEDAGFIIHPSIFGWAFGSGFPKATRVDYSPDSEWLASFVDVPGEVFKGHRYGLQALKPALEPIIVFQKPYSGRAVDCITSTGAGAMWIEGARVGAESTTRCNHGGTGNPKEWRTGNGSDFTSGSASGRWPANLIILDEAAAARMDEMSGERPSGARPARRNKSIWGDNATNDGERIEYDSGGSSRFFYNVREQIDEADPLYYYSKASREERDAGLEGMPSYDSSVGDRRPSGSMSQRIHADEGRPETKGRNPHPTIKPIDLTRYLATLLLPPAEYAPRRLFVPFAGSGSECIGGMYAEFENITGVELNNDDEHRYVDLARARVDYWHFKAGLFPSFAE